ncbi:MAG: ABC transporter substrate-binding protein [candidate division Zixibacteria bacterium]|nr:ABC transporter substrate-binding protein [candidate division Zixibacteria bacterium]
MNLKKLKVLFLGLIVLVFGLKAQGATLTIQVIKSGELKAYEEAYSGFQKVLRENLKEVQFQEYVLKSKSDENEKILKQIDRTALILTLGTEATKFASNRIKDRPIIFCMVLDPVGSGLVESLAPSGNNLSGSSLYIPVKMQLEKFKLLVPNLKNLGVLYTSETEGKVKKAEVVAKSLGINLVSVKITSEREIPQSLEYLKEQTQGLWSVPDGTIFSPSSTEQLLLFTLRNGIPFMGLSSVYVRAGALFALDCDYEDRGKQAGEIALLVLSGKPPSEISIARPRKTYLFLNQRTADRIGLMISESLLTIAEEIIR